ncbi:site-specific integrase [uncultured Anaerococcus sp.]|uniref:site-specific integrase n=1 Tax=uncultured Anaerococcus sp. TaxID=293428 RepID=UPI0025EFA603|nr:site-specific integrase [uncultured Anaerococcus sp.]
MWYVYFRILSLTGMRKGEAQALEWDDINFKENKIRINKTISTYGRNKKHISNPKTSSSNRIISVDKTSIDLLKDRKKEQKEWNKNIRVEDKTQKYIFTTKDNELTYHNAPRKQFLKVVKNNNLRKIRLHDLRHTHASLCFEAGMSPKDVQYRLGHKEIQTTLDVYTKVTRGKEKASIEKFTDFMEI